MAEHPLVTFEQDGAIGIITLRRPEKFNALDIPMLRALETALDEAELAADVRVVLVRGEGKGFCAGGDIEAWAAMSAACTSQACKAANHTKTWLISLSPPGCLCEKWIRCLWREPSIQTYVSFAGYKAGLKSLIPCTPNPAFIALCSVSA